MQASVGEGAHPQVCLMRTCIAASMLVTRAWHVLHSPLVQSSGRDRAVYMCNERKACFKPGHVLTCRLQMRTKTLRQRSPQAFRMVVAEIVAFRFQPFGRESPAKGEGAGAAFGEPRPKRACDDGQAVCSTSEAEHGDAHDFQTLRDDSQGVCEVAVKLPTNQRVSATFGLAQPLSDLVAWLSAQDWDMQQHRLSRAYPRQPLQEHERSLKDVGLAGPRDMLILERSS